jgi:uncharacterized protein YkwD
MTSDFPFGRGGARRRAWLACAAATCALSACGGGGETPAPGVAGPPSAAAPAPAPQTLSTCNLLDFAASALARVNQHRAAGATCGSRGAFPPAAALAWNDRLTQAADVHSRDMQGNNFFSHTGSGGSSASQRVDAAGYAWSSVGENIAAGYPTVNAVVDGWMASEGHCANLMNANFSDFGLACVSGAPSNTYSTYWTMDLARSR